MRNIRENATLLSAGATLGLLLCEIILRTIGVPTFFDSHTLPPQFSFPVTKEGMPYYTNLPSANITFVYDGNPRGYFDDNNAVSHKTNSLGFRGREFLFKKSPRRIRIAFLGDSFTFGEGVWDNHVFSQVAIKYLNSKIPREKRVRFEGYNFGVGGFNMEQSLSLLKNLVLKMNPDIVVLGYALNDAEPRLFYYDDASRSVERRDREENIHEGLSDIRPPESIIFKLNIGKLIWQCLQKRRTTHNSIKYYNSLYEGNGASWIQTREYLRQFIETCSGDRIECYVACFPIFYQLNDRYPFIRIHKLVEREVTSVSSEHVHFIDLFPRFKGMKDIDLWVHPTDQHPNEIAHRIVAKALAEMVFEKYRDRL